ncbi:MAG: hypothetical protein JNK63_09840 [Chthonomonas sp.]|nr:hypothetical protein [Chthonomonas sp.]
MKRLSKIDSLAALINGEALAIPHVCARFGITDNQIYDRRHYPPRPAARQALFWLVLEYSGASCEQFEHHIGFSAYHVYTRAGEFSKLMAEDVELAKWAKMTLSLMRGGYILDSAGVPAA